MPPDSIAGSPPRVAIELIDIAKSFTAGSETIFAVERMNLKIMAGEFFTFLGPSGCGKTTTLRMIAGFEEPTSGQIILDGGEVTDVPAHKRNVNTVFQSYALFPHLTVEQNVAFGLAVKGVAKEERIARVRSALEAVHMAHAADRRPSALSGGQQQRIALARALVNRPSVLLLDEPFGALDLKLRRDMQLEVKEMQRKLGVTFVFVTHDQEEALTMSDRIAVMNQGVIRQVDHPVGIYERPVDRFTAGFIGDMNLIEAEVLGRSAARVQLCAAGEMIDLEDDETLSAGMKVTLAIRPEALGLANNISDPPSSLDGHVREVVYVGTDSLCDVALKDGTLVRARLRNSLRGPAFPSPGEAARLCYHPSSIRILTR